ncbi:PatB family C-S lyase [Leuconostoc falkenbergense]|uniref:MalY/PatB family protein n=1 Tax=Leuconostoc falkenbergense TaxID=2766470 RepID=UPI0024AC8E7C|nr:PatB family C-S lyase [Leuconostoc falkenbergense]MDI6666717.1 PatB family C-S lyase [Leuconostoc falkenbergense]
MSNYDFESIIDRRNSNSVKWHVADNELPMWIADMDFATAPEILTAMREKISLGAFGYEAPNKNYFNAIISWFAKRHHVKIQPDWINFVTGVVPALSSVVRRLSHVGDNVVVMTPVYDIFFHSIENNGRHVLESPLRYNAKKHHYDIDWDNLENQLANPLSTLLILCNPHNPVGKTWSQKTISRIVMLCQKYGVAVVSDEIHGDIVLGEPTYQSLLSLPAKQLRNAVVLFSPSKAFNMAALHAASIVVPDKSLRETVMRGINNDELAEPNLVAIEGSMAAYEQGEPWLEQLIEQLKHNRQQVEHFLLDRIPEVKIASENATYLIWLDVSGITKRGSDLVSHLRTATGLILSAGDVYRGNGNNFVRMNIACPTKLLSDGLLRLEEGIKTYTNLK